MDKNKTIFVDRKGKRWSRTNLQDLIDAFASFKDFTETFEYYSHRL
jgi:hypothetical protein